MLCSTVIAFAAPMPASIQPSSATIMTGSVSSGV